MLKDPAERLYWGIFAASLLLTLALLGLIYLLQPENKAIQGGIALLAALPLLAGYSALKALEAAKTSSPKPRPRNCCQPPAKPME